MSKYQKKNQQPEILQTIIVGIAKMIWWLVTLPFKGTKFGISKQRMSTQDKNYIISKRLEIEKSLNTENEIELKHTVMEADKLVDYALQVQGYPGQTFADRLRSAQQSLSSSLYNQVWQGHKVRNQIAHEQEFRISNVELRSSARQLINYLKTL